MYVCAQSPYCVEPNKHYSFHAPGVEPDTCGTLCVDTASRTVHFYIYERRDLEGGCMLAIPHDEWEEHMAERGYVLTPLIQRGGACVRLNIGTDDKPEQALGCLVRHPETDTQFHHPTMHYQALVAKDNSLAYVFFTDALRGLVPVGTVMYLRMGVIDDERFILPPDREDRFLLTRLNVPCVEEPEVGKLYVTALHKRFRPRGQADPPVAETFPVNPWDVILKDWFPEEDGMAERVEKYLKSRQA
jgi:hypothetical protein